MFRQVYKLCKFVIGTSLLSIAIQGNALAAAYYSTLDELPDVKELKHVSFETPMKIYTHDGKLIGEFGEHKRIPVSLKDIPLKMQQAFLAIEDSRFYDHTGVDPIGIVRAITVASASGGASQGASTITQQVARNFFLTRDRTIERKVKEMFLAWRIEQVLSKQEILELYLNKIALGHRSYGVVAAAQTYYGKDLDELTLAEIATIAGLPKAPSTLNPITSPERAKERRHLVLLRMLTLGYITEDEFKEADNAPSKATFHSAQLEAYAPYVAEEARQAVLHKYGEEAYTRGFKIYTTVESDYQDYAHDAIFKHVTAYDVRHGYRGPLFNIFDETRGIRGTEKQATKKTGANANANNGVIMKARQDYSNHAGKGSSYSKVVSYVNRRHLVKDDFNAIPHDKLLDILNRENKYHSLHPAIVLSIDDTKKTAMVLTPEDKELPLTWEGMSWARAFRNDRTQGGAPSCPSEFLLPGDLIFTYNQQKSTPAKKRGEAAKTYELLTLTQLPDVEAALIAIEPYSGAVKAMSGGFDFEKSKFNRTTQLLRQTGSNFKPFIYSSAVASNISVNSVLPDEPINTWDAGSRRWWRPRNSPNRFEGLMTLREGLAKSKNSIAIRTIRQVGVKNAVQHLRKFGIFVPRFQQNESMALGTVELTPLQVASSYAAFANGGYALTPYLIERIELEDGHVLYQSHPKYVNTKAPDIVENSVAMVYSKNYKPNAEDKELLERVNDYPQYVMHQLEARQREAEKELREAKAALAGEGANANDPIVDTSLPEQVPQDYQERIANATAALNAVTNAQQNLTKKNARDPRAASGVILMDLDLLAKKDPINPNATQILSHAHAYIMSTLLHSNIYGGKGISGTYRGTGARAITLTGRDDLHGKTGTTNNVHDAWFSGFNNNLVSTAWVGFDNDRDLGYSRTRGSESGGATALPIFSEFFKNAQNGKESAPIPKPKDVITIANRGVSEPAIKGMRLVDEGSSTAAAANTGINSSSVKSVEDIF